MQKSFKWVVSFIIALVALPMFGTSVLAEEGGQFKDGEYNIDYEVLYEDDDAPVDVDRFFKKPATLKINDGNQSIQLKYTSSDMILALDVPNADVKIISEDEDKKTRVVEIKTDADLSKSMEMGLEMFYGTTHDVKVEFDVSDVPVKTEEADEDGNNENKVIDLDDGYYTMNASYLKADKDDSSSMGSYMDDSVFLTVEDGKVLPTITINEDETVTKLQVNGKNAIEKKVDGDKRYETFELANLESMLNAYVEYQAPYNGEVFEGQADFRISLDKGTIKKAKEEQKPGYEISDDSKQNEDNPKGNDDGKKDSEKGNDDSNKKDSYQKSEPEKAYEYDYVVNHATEDKASAADDFFKKPATVLHKDGKKYIQLTVTNWDWIDYLKTSNSDVKVVKENKDGSVLIQFKVDGKLTDAIALKMKVTVPGVYSEEHTARLILDINSKKKVDASDYKIAVKSKKVDKKDNGDTKGNTNKGTNGSKNDTTKSTQTTKKEDLKWDQAFEYNFVVKHATEDETSAADKFFKKPATVLYKDGEKYIQLTITNWDWIKSLTPESGEIVVVQKNKDGSAVIQFKVNGDLSDAIMLDMHVVVPKEVAGMDYDMKHTARLFLDLDSKKEVDTGDYAVTILDSENGEVANPQTGDTSNIWLYTLLLIGSIVPLSIKMKRRFV